MSNAAFSNTLTQAISLISISNHISVLTGAGISTPSGIPDFRTKNSGLWEKADPMEAVSLSTFSNHPDVFFDWLFPFANQLKQSKPNVAHQVLAKMQNQRLVSSIITQNIDGLHQTAGSHDVIELHGNIKNWQCLHGHPLADQENIFSDYCETGEKPICPICKNILKPAIVFFEEALPYQAWDAALHEAKHCDLMIVIGSSLVVEPANELPYIAMQNGAKLMIITLSNTPLDPYASLVIHKDVVFVLSEMKNGLGL